MGKKREIGKAFKEQLGSLSDSPDPAVWDHIDAAFPEKKRRLIPLWIFIVGGLLFFLGGLYVGELLFSTEFTESPSTDVSKHPAESFKPSSTISNANEKTYNLPVEETERLEEVVKVKNTTSNNSNVASGHRPTMTATPNAILKTNPSKTLNATGSSKTSRPFNRNDATVSNTSEQIAVTQQQQEDLDETEVRQSTPTETLSKELAIEELNDVENTPLDESNIEESDASEDSEELADKDEDDSTLDPPVLDYSKWSVTVQGIADYYSSNHSEHPVSPSLNGTKQSFEINFNYGFTLNYNATEKLQIRIGVNNQDFDQVYENIAASDIPYASLTHVGLSVSENTYNSFLNTGDEINIVQSLQYFNIPLEVRYHFLGKKVQLTGIGGFDYFGLVKNEIILENSTDQLNIGSNNKIENFTWGVHAGVGSRYPLLKDTFFLNADFIFTYQPFSYLNTPNIQPSILSTRLGIEYKF